MDERYFIWSRMQVRNAAWNQHTPGFPDEATAVARARELAEQNGRREYVVREPGPAPLSGERIIRKDV